MQNNQNNPSRQADMNKSRQQDQNQQPPTVARDRVQSERSQQNVPNKSTIHNNKKDDAA